MKLADSVDYRIKGKAFRAHLNYLRDGGRFHQVRALVSPEIAAIMDHPPLPSAWVEGKIQEAIRDGVYELEGAVGVLRMARAAIDREMLPFFFPVLRGIMRMVGTSPATLFARLEDIIRSSCQGIDFRYTALSERSGVMNVAYHHDRHINEIGLLTVVPSLETVFRVCAVAGTVGEPEILGPREARFQLHW